MRKHQKEAILISFFKEKYKYERLAEFVVHFIKDDPSAPKKSLYTITYRIKDEARLIEKIDKENKKLGVGETPITQKNFQERIGDLLGIRFICLRLSDIEKVKTYLDFLAEEKIIQFIEGPDQKRSFVLPIDPGESVPDGIDLQYGGYSSIHYQAVMLENSDVPDELKGLQIEFQLRTILEEAWGEIDHKYRYVFSRSGHMLPEYIHTGFYNLSAYLQVAAMQAEHLCRQVEAHRQLITIKAKEKLIISPVVAGLVSDKISTDKSRQAESMIILKSLLKERFGFTLSDRTLIYILKRLNEFGYAEQPQLLFQKVFTEDRLREFETIFREILNVEPFSDNHKKNVDVINALNFALFDKSQGRDVAREGLKSVLRWRKERSKS